MLAPGEISGILAVRLLMKALNHLGLFSTSATLFVHGLATDVAIIKLYNATEYMHSLSITHCHTNTFEH